jgi:hypothetical protein
MRRRHVITLLGGRGGMAACGARAAAERSSALAISNHSDRPSRSRSICASASRLAVSLSVAGG